MKEKKQKSEKETEKLAEEIKQKNDKIIKEEKKLKGMTENLKKQIENVKKLAEERLNQLKYLQADFDNYRKKFDKEKRQIIELANENLIKELIIILDDFENSIKLVENEKNKEGITLLQRKFFNILEKHGLRKIEVLGKKFDPNFHEVLYKELNKEEDGSILEEIQRGYMICSKVIRPSKVKISEKNLNNQSEVKNS